MPATRDTLRFVLQDGVRELRQVEPTTTVLRYLRETERLCGTKEGCAEGDCGACTVVLGEERNGKVRYRAVNSCIQFLPTLDGKWLLTVEDLKGSDGALHGVQEAMVSCHGSQCGFCTPGFVMSLFALSRETEAPSHAEIDDALAGNLCRCTGYGTIIEAAQRMHEGPGGSLAEKEDRALALLQEIKSDDMLALDHEGRRYFAPTSCEELAALVSQHPEACILSGGTDVGLWVTKQHRALDTVIFVGRVPELQEVRDLGEEIEIGAAVTYSEAFDLIADLNADFGEMLRRLGSRQIRNLGTIGGNIANGSPIGDMPPALIALGATLRLNKQGERREISLEDYFLDYGVQDRQPGEFVETVRFRKPREDSIFRIYKLSKRFDQDISAVCGAFNVTLEGNRVRDARICFGGMAPTPRRASACEAALRGADWTEASLRRAMAALAEDYQPISDMRASKDYRLQAARNLLLKVFVESGEPTTRTRVLDAAEVG